MRNTMQADLHPDLRKGYNQLTPTEAGNCISKPHSGFRCYNWKAFLVIAEAFRADVLEVNADAM